MLIILFRCVSINFGKQQQVCYENTNTIVDAADSLHIHFLTDVNRSEVKINTANLKITYERKYL